MEPANIDWNNIESIFVEDPLYEHINAPKFIDFSAPNEPTIDDEAWFCKSDCRHPKTAEDFLGSATKVKHQRSLSLNESLPLRDRNTRGAVRLNKSKTMKPPHSERSREDEEKENNATPPEKRKPLKSTLSASNLFAGRDIFNQITEFCSELKKMVMKSKDVESAKKKDGDSDQKKKLLEENVKEIMPVEVAKTMQACNEKKTPRKLKMADKENASPITLDLKKVNPQGQGILQVRTNPPSPQCFSAYREPLRRAAKPPTPLKLSKSSIHAENGVLQEVGQSNYRVEKEEPMKKVNSHNQSQSISVGAKEAKSMEMFWILKPCITK